MSDRYTRYAASTGIFFAILIVLVVLIQPKPPAADAPAGEVFGYVVDHRDVMHVIQLIVAAATFLFIWFIGTLRSVLAAAEGGEGRLAGTAYGAGLIASTCMILSLTMLATAALHPVDNGPELTRVLTDASAMVLAVSAPSIIAFFVANGLSILRSGVLPAWLAWLAFVTALFGALGIGAVFTDQGAFASDGIFGFRIGTFLLMLWTLLTSIALVRKLSKVQPADA